MVAPSPLTLDTVLNTADTTNNLVNKFVVSPLVNLGIAGFAFDIFEEHKSEQLAEITDHFVEDNSTIQDHIAIKPNKITLRGFVGELVEERADPKSKVVELTQKLTVINSYIPVVTGAARQINSLITSNKASTVDAIDETIGTGVDLFQAYKALNPPDGKQAKAYNFFRALFDAKQLVAVDTPFGFFSDMAIENIVSIQGDNAYITDFAVTLKEFRTAETKLVDFDEKKRQGRASNQIATKKDQGTANGKEEDASLFFKVKQSLFGG
jgi:hypothetical protein